METISVYARNHPRIRNEYLNFKLVSFLLAVLSFAIVANAAVTAYEPFNYSGSIANGTATTGSGFTGNWTCGGAGTAVSGLTYPNLPTANSALQSGSSRQFETFSSPLS